MFKHYLLILVNSNSKEFVCTVTVGVINVPFDELEPCLIKVISYLINIMKQKQIFMH